MARVEIELNNGTKKIVELDDNFTDSDIDEISKQLNAETVGQNNSVETQEKGIDLTPSGLIDNTANAIVSAIETPYRMVRDKQNPIKAFQSAYNVGKNARKSFEQEHPILSGTRDLGIDLLGYGLLPNKGGFVGQAAIQGGLPFALESLKEGENPLPGFGIGTGLGLGIQSLPYIGNVAKFMPAVSKYVARSVGRLEPETLAQAVKPNSKALDLDSKAKLTDFANNITNRVRNSFNNLLAERGENVRNAINNLGLDTQRITADDIRNDISAIFNNYNRDAINPARNMTGSLEADLQGLVNQAEQSTSDMLAKELSALQNDLRLSEDAFSNNRVWSKEKEDEAFRIISEATGKPINWLKSQLNASHNGSNWFGRQVGREDNYLRGMTKRQENIQKMIEDYLSKPEDVFMSGERFNYYPMQGNGTNEIWQAYEDILNRNFYEGVASPLDLEIARADNQYRSLLKDLLNKNQLTADDATQFSNNLDIAFKNLPDEMLEKEYSRAADDWSRIENFINRRNSLQGTISPLSLQGIKEQIGKMSTWQDEVARQYKNPILEQLYGRLNNRLSALSPELAEANKGFAELAGLKKKEGVSRILKAGDNIDSATRALDNFDSSYLKGNTSQNVRDLENILTNEGYAPFVGDVEDVIAAKNLNKIATTGDSWLANIVTGLTRPALMGQRAINRTKIPELYNATKEALRPLAQRLLTPFAARTAAPLLLQGGVSNITDDYGYEY